MSEPRSPRGAESAAASTDDDRGEFHIDWSAIESEPEFRELVQRRRSFVLPASIFFLVYYMVFIVVTAVAPGFMGERVYEGLTVGYTYALTQFVMVFALGIWYLRKSANEFDPLAQRAIARYVDEHPEDARREGLVKPDGGFDRPAGSRETVR